jgi:hypothetical protein
VSKTTTLGESQLTQSPNETITVELVQPDDMPPIVKIGWPLQPTVIDPERFRDVAARAGETVQRGACHAGPYPSGQVLVSALTNDRASQEQFL